MNSITDKKTDLLRLVQLIVFIGIILYFGRPLFIPLSFAILISFTLYPICKWLENKKFPRPLAIFLPLFFLTLLLGGLLLILTNQIQQFSQEWPFVQKKLSLLISKLSTYLSTHANIPVSQQSKWMEDAISTGLPQLFPFIRQVIYNSATGLVLLILIPFFSALMLYHREHYTLALLRLFPEAQKPNILQTLKETVITFYNFIKGMALVYLVVAVLNVTALFILGIPHAVLFGIMAALLTFIPYIGITLGSLLPITLAWITYDSLWYPLGVVLSFMFIQYLEASLIFPLAVSHRLNVNTLFILIAIIAGGLIWGAAGMILFVPFVAILKLVSDKIEGWKWLAVMLGSNKN